MKPTVYIETTVISYLTAWPSRDLLRAAQQRSTREWWETRRESFDVVSSQLVVLECSSGDVAAAEARLSALKNVPLLEVTEQAAQLADELVAQGAIPKTADRDALHVAICALNGVQYLLTWNFRHLANAVMRDKINDVCESQGYKAPVICTADELFTEDLP
jgi:hypothetical protein